MGQEYFNKGLFCLTRLIHKKPENANTFVDMREGQRLLRIPAVSSMTLGRSCLMATPMALFFRIRDRHRLRDHQRPVMVAPALRRRPARRECFSPLLLPRVRGRQMHFDPRLELSNPSADLENLQPDRVELRPGPGRSLRPRRRSTSRRRRTPASEVTWPPSKATSVYFPGCLQKEGVRC